MYMKYYIDIDIMKDSSHYGDILAIPFFAILIAYFYKVEHKSGVEYLLLYFSINYKVIKGGKVLYQV